MNEKMPDVRDVAKNLADVFDVMGYDLASFNFDVLSGAISIIAKEKTAGAGTPNGQGDKCNQVFCHLYSNTENQISQERGI